MTLTLRGKIPAQPTDAPVDHGSLARGNHWDTRMIELAQLIATWSRDPSTGVGAIIVRGNRVVSLGYNGFPRGIHDSPERYADRAVKYPMVLHAEVPTMMAPAR